MQNNSRFPNVKYFFSAMLWLSIILILVILIVNALIYSSFSNGFQLSWNLQQTELTLLITFCITAIVGIIGQLIVKLFHY